MKFLEVLVKFPWFVLLWLFVILIRFPLTVIGWIVLPFALHQVQYERLPGWAWLWDNDEDGLDGPAWYQKKHPDLSKFWLRFYWLGFRNRVNNLRNVSFIKLHIVPDRVRYIGSDIAITPRNARTHGKRILWHLAWQGIKAGFWCIIPLGTKRHFRTFIGWKVRPHHQEGVTGYARFGVGFGAQFMPYRKG